LRQNRESCSIFDYPLFVAYGVIKRDLTSNSPPDR